MAHWAKINENNVVTEVIVANEDVIQSGIFGDPDTWIQTSYNTRHGEHGRGGTPFRKNFAGVDSIWDPVRDAFYAPQPYPSWLFDEETCSWKPPKPCPYDTKPWVWNEELLDWQKA